jgi:hypothetical protein
MFKRMHDIMVGTLVLIAILLAITSNYWLPHVNHMTYLFKDNVTIGLIAAVVVLLTLYDCKLGIAFAFVVAVVAVNLEQEGFEAFADIKRHMPTTTRPMPTTTRPMATKPIKAPKTRIEQFQNMAPEQGANVIGDKIEKQMRIPSESAKCVVNQSDFNTYSSGKDYHGFDVAGCRYDLENKTQNSTVYGPPLSWCATYGKGNTLPVPFYPLNG